MRDYAGFLATRRRILETKPAQRSSWVASAMAHYLAGEHDQAVDLISKSNDAISDKAPPYEESEMLLFQNMCLEKSGKLEEALVHLNTHEAGIVDKLAMRVKHAELTVLLGRFEEGQALWLRLLIDQSDNYRFHAGFQTAFLRLDQALSAQMFALKRLDLPSTVLHLEPSQLLALLVIYRSGKFSSRASKKIELSLCQGAELEAGLEAHIRKGLSDGLPALYHDVCSLIRQSDPNVPGATIFVRDAYDFRRHPVAELALAIVDRLVSNLRSTSNFDGIAEDAANALPSPPVVEKSVDRSVVTKLKSSKIECPTSLLWAMFLQCHLLEKCGELGRAMALIEECVAHTPTAPDMLVKRARLLKKSGNIQGAAVAADESRALDLQDRYLNNKATKYLLRANLIPQALDTIALFTRHEGDPQAYLAEMQSSWFELEAGEAHARLKQWGPALRKFFSVQRHFHDYLEDMSDFHGFSVRKSTFRAYIGVLEMQDVIYGHKFFQRAFRGAVGIMMHLLEEPEDVDGLGHLPAADRKKEKAKRKKLKEKQAKADEVAQKAAAEEAKYFGKSLPIVDSKDDDINGEKLMTKNFLEEVGLWCQHLSVRAIICEPDTLALMCAVMLRRGKLAAAARTLLCGLGRSPKHPSLVVMLVKAMLVIRSAKVTGGGGGSGIKGVGVAFEVASAEIEALLGDSDLAQYVSDFCRESADETSSFAHRISAARCILLLNAAGIAVDGETSADGAKARACLLLDGDAPWRGRNVTPLAASDAYQVYDSRLFVVIFFLIYFLLSILIC